MARHKSAAILEPELIERLSQITGHDKEVVRDIIKGLTEFVTDELKNETPVRIGKLGELYTSTYMGRGGYDFRKGAINPNKLITKVKFNPSAQLKRAVEILTENYHE